MHAMRRDVEEKVGLLTILVGLIFVFMVTYELRDLIFRHLPYREECSLVLLDDGTVCTAEDMKAYTGVIRSFDAKGNDVYSFCIAGSMTGPYKIYSGNVLVEKGMLADGRISGNRYIYSESGILVEKTHYENGVKQGKSFAYNEVTGNLVATGSFSDGEMCGLWSQYDQKGNLMRETFYENGFMSASL